MKFVSFVEILHGIWPTKMSMFKCMLKRTLNQKGELWNPSCKISIPYYPQDSNAYYHASIFRDGLSSTWVTKSLGSGTRVRKSQTGCLCREHSHAHRHSLWKYQLPPHHLFEDFMRKPVQTQERPCKIHTCSTRGGSQTYNSQFIIHSANIAPP